MRLRHIEVFFAVWRNGSVTAAAEELAISQSSVSKTLKHAEQSLGFELFHRLRGKLVLSEEGEVLLNDAARIHESLEQLRSRALGLRTGLARSLRVVCLPSLGQWLLPQSLVRLRAAFPQLALEITTKHEGEMLEGLRARDYDIGFSFGPAGACPQLPGLSSALVTEGRMVHIAPPDAGQSGGWAAPIALDAIDHAGLIGLSGRHFLGNSLRERLGVGGATDGAQSAPPHQAPHQAQTLVQTYSVARELVANGMGTSIVDEFTALTPPIDVVIRPLAPEIRFGLHVHRREGSPASKPARALLSAVRETARAARPASDGPKS